MKLVIDQAAQTDAAEVLSLRLLVGARMQERFGNDRWAPPITERSVLRLFHGSRTKVLIGRIHGEIVALTRMQTKKPRAFDLKYFTAGVEAVYLADVEVSPKFQGQGLGTQLMAAAIDHARGWPAHAVRTSAYNGRAGAGPFYAKCGFREMGRVTYRKIPMIYFEMIL